MTERTTSYLSPARLSPASSHARLAQGAVAGLAAVTLASLSQRARAVSPALTFAQIPGTGDIKVLNYALALEDLEADLYAQALLRLTTGGTNALGKHITGLGLAASQLDVTYVQSFSRVEADHRDFLKAALAAQAITTTNPFKYDFGFDDAGNNNGRQQVLETLLTAEATGVQAYLGAIPKFAAGSPYLQTAAAIQGTEARHTSVLTIVRNLLSAQGVMTAPIAAVAPLAGDVPNGASYDSTRPSNGTVEGRDQTLDPDTVLARVSPFIVPQ